MISKISGCYLLLGLLALVGSMPAAAADVAVPPVNPESVARLSGLDPQTLEVAEVDPKVRQRINEHVAQYFRAERPKLLTYRAIWAEMHERRANLRISAAENVFDPCQFVTDEALEKANAAVREARQAFREHCGKANQGAAELLAPEQYALVQHAAQNVDVPAPYRWLEMDQRLRKQVLRLVKIHEARQALQRKYPHLQQRQDGQDLRSMIVRVLPDAQKEVLETIEDRMQKPDAAASDEQEAP